MLGDYETIDEYAEPEPQRQDPYERVITRVKEMLHNPKELLNYFINDFVPPNIIQQFNAKLECDIQKVIKELELK